MNKKALITGASSGIGKALAVEFAKHGFDLLLTARNGERLASLADELRDRYGVDVVMSVADLANAENLESLINLAASESIDVLVNNAGFAVKGDFTETAIRDETEMLDVQLSAMLKLTKAVLPNMVKERSGLILNVASVYSFSPVPQQSVYAACKSFIYSFSSSLKAELRSTGVSVSVLAPGITRTEFRTRAGIADKKTVGMSAEAVAEIAVQRALKGHFLIIPGLQNRLFVFLSRHLPLSITTYLIKRINTHRGLGSGT